MAAEQNIGGPDNLYYIRPGNTGKPEVAQNEGAAQNDPPMDTVSRYELDAKLEAIEARMEGRVARIEEAMSEIRNDLKAVLADNKETRGAISSLKTTTVVTGISVALAIVFGIAAFNATLLSNMIASFESGKGTAAAITQATEQLKQTQEQLKAVEQRIVQSRSAAQQP